MSLEQYFAANRELWDKKVEHHARSKFYDVESFRKGKNVLNPAELEALGDVTGKTILHLQCHFGMDTLSLARLGAKVTGIDLSEKSITQARALSEELEIPGRFIVSNVYDIGDHLEGEEFDLVFTSYGAHCWLPDLDRWAELIHAHLKPGGKFVFAEFHPFWNALDWNTLEVGYNYFGKGNSEPYEEDSQGSYTDGSEQAKGKEYFWLHSLDETMRGFLRRGMQLTDLTEYPYSYYDCFPNLIKDDKGHYYSKEKSGMIPMMFRMVMEKAGPSDE